MRLCLKCSEAWRRWSALDDKIFKEGSALFYLPFSPSFLRSDGKVEPSWMPVFYNPYSASNRDLTVLALRAYQKMGGRTRTFVEPLSGICVRSIRALLESNADDMMAYASDIDPLAAEYCRKNAELNGLRTRLFSERSDARMFLLRMDSEGVPVDSLDIDPYGSPIYYFDSAIKSIGKEALVSITATDLGALTGRYKDVGMRRYCANLTASQFSKEVGARVLIGSFVRTASYLERDAEPLFSFYREHYLKVIFRVRRSRSGAVRSSEQLGFICIDEEGTYISSAPVGILPQGNCSAMLGPLWIGQLWDKDFVKRIKEEASISDFILPETKKGINEIAEEMEVKAVGYYNLYEMSSQLKVNVPPFSRLIEVLREMGYLAGRTHFDKKGIKTNAPASAVREAILQLSSRLSAKP